MKFEILSDIPSATEVIALESDNYPEGFYVINNTLWIKDKNGTVTFIWSSVQDYFTEPVEPTKKESTPERGDTISEEFLLKVLAIAKQPDLIKEI